MKAFSVVCLAFLVAVGAQAWADLPQVVTQPRIPAAELGRKFRKRTRQG